MPTGALHTPPSSPYVRALQRTPPAMPHLLEALQASLGSSYTIEHELGGAGMSRVFVAQETALQRKVVLKVLPPSLFGALSVERFERETLLAARMQHPYIVPILSAGKTDRWFYY